MGCRHFGQVALYSRRLRIEVVNDNGRYRQLRWGRSGTAVFGFFQFHHRPVIVSSGETTDLF